jgi:hypothetical protein
MQYTGYTIIVVLTVALALAVGLVLFWIGRIVRAIIKDARSTTRPAPTQQHPEFGNLKFEEGIWSGKAQQEGRAIAFAVAGDKSGPDVTLIEKLRDAISRLSAFERMALEFIRIHEPAGASGVFRFQSLDFLCRGKPDAFALELALSGDDDGVWRVEFEQGRPKSVGRDD